MKIKQTLSRLEEERKEMDLRIGVLQHALLTALLDEKKKNKAEMARRTTERTATFAMHTAV